MQFKLNEAEQIIEYFWDKCIFDRAGWQVKGISFKEESPPCSIYQKTPREVGDGLYVSRNWNGFTYGVLPGKKLEMTKKFDIACSGFDSIVLSCQLYKDTVLRISAECDGKKFCESYKNGSPYNEEFSLNISGKTLKYITIEIENCSSEEKSGSFRALILRSTALLNNILENRVLPDKKWTPYLKDDEYTPDFLPEMGGYMDGEAIDKLRKKLGEEKIAQMVKECENAPEPEQFFKDYSGAIENHRFSMVRDYDISLLQYAPKLALTGVLSKRDDIARMAIRYALTIALCPYWLESFICNAPGAIFEHKAFATAICCEQIVTVMELCGEYLTDVGREFLLRRLAEAGISHINWIVWKYSGEGENIFRMNQLAWFSRGRIPAYIMLSRFWNRTKNYLKLAYDELCDSINEIILPDGGYGESIGYLVSVAHYSGMAFYKYAKEMNVNPSEIMPKAYSRTADYVECFISFDNDMDYIPVGDAGANVMPDRYAALAALMPNSHWRTLFRRAWKRKGGKTDDVFTMMLENEIPEKEYDEYKSFIRLPNCGVVSSLRKYKDEYVKFLLWGGIERVAHQHPDKGSFVLQFAGETIFTDTGIAAYGHEICGKMGSSYWHSVLIPVDEKGFVRQKDLTKKIIPDAKGDENQLYCSINLENAWNGYFGKYTRSIISETPDVFEICDEFSDVGAEYVEFQLITPLDAEIKDNIAYIEGNKTITTVCFDGECEGYIEYMPEYNGKIYKRIAFRIKSSLGSVKAKVKVDLK